MDWQPIDSVRPAYGESVLVWFLGRIALGQRCHQGGPPDGWYIDHAWTTNQPTMWQPLPPTPAALHDWRDPARPEARRDADGLLVNDPDGAVE